MIWKINTALALVTAILMIATLFAHANCEDKGNRLCNADLTEEQRTEIKEIVSGMKEEGATWIDIHFAVLEKLQEFGADVTEHPLSLLTEEDVAEISGMIETMKVEEKTREEICEAVREKLESLGIDVPEEKPEGKFRGRGGKGRMGRGRRGKPEISGRTEGATADLAALDGVIDDVMDDGTVMMAPAAPQSTSSPATTWGSIKSE